MKSLRAAGWSLLNRVTTRRPLELCADPGRYWKTCETGTTRTCAAATGTL